MALGATWMVALRLTDRSLGLVSMLLLARLLVPHDFGIVAMAMSFVALLELLTSFGFDVALIQKQARDREQWDTAWTFDVLFGIGVAAVLVILAGPVAGFYKTVELESVIRILAIGSIIQGFQNIGVVAFRKDLRFDREFRFLILKKFASFLVTIPAAIILESYWALVIGQIFGKVAGTALSYGVHPYRPRLTLASAGSLLHFSKWLLATNLTTYLWARSSDWIVGRISGAQALGTYNLGFEIAALPGTELVAPINRALLPAYSRLAGSLDRLRAEYLSVLSVVVLVGIPAVVGLAATAPLMVPVVLGPNWQGVAPVLMILAFSGVTQMVTGNVFPLYMAMGRTDLVVKVTLVPAVLFVALLLLVVPRFGVVGAATSALISSLVAAPLSLFLITRMLELNLLDIVRAVYRPFVAAAIMCTAVLLYSSHVVGQRATGATWPELLLSVTIGLIIYPLLVLLLWLIAGKPEGGERMLWRKGEEAWTRVTQYRWPRRPLK